MKSIVALLAGILAANLCAQECDFTAPDRGSSSYNAGFGYLAMALYLFDGSHLDLSNMGQRDPAINNISCSDTAWMYRSELDTTLVVIVTEAFVKVARVPYSAETANIDERQYTVHYDDVYRDEFSRLQKAGVFKGTAEQADSLVNHVIELCGRYHNDEFSYGGCEFNPPELRRRNGGKDVDVADVPLAIMSVAGEFNTPLDTLNFCPGYRYPASSLSSSSSSISSSSLSFSSSSGNAEPASSSSSVKTAEASSSSAGNKESASVIHAGKVSLGLTVTKVKPRHYYIGNVKSGTPYKAFSVNGQLLEQGILSDGQFIAPATPVVLQLNGKQMLMLNP